MADQFSQILALLQQQNAKLEALGTRMTELERQTQAESLGGAEASVLAAGPVTMTGTAGTMVAATAAPAAAAGRSDSAEKSPPTVERPSGGAQGSGPEPPAAVVAAGRANDTPSEETPTPAVEGSPPALVARCPDSAPQDAASVGLAAAAATLHRIAGCIWAVHAHVPSQRRPGRLRFHVIGRQHGIIFNFCGRSTSAPPNVSRFFLGNYIMTDPVGGVRGENIL